MPASRRRRIALGLAFVTVLGLAAATACAFVRRQPSRGWAQAVTFEDWLEELAPLPGGESVALALCPNMDHGERWYVAEWRRGQRALVEIPEARQQELVEREPRLRAAKRAYDVWDPQPHDVGGPIYARAVSPREDLIAALVDDSPRIALWRSGLVWRPAGNPAGHAETGTVERTVTTTEPARRAAFSPDGSRLLVATQGGFFELFEVATGERRLATGGVVEGRVHEVVWFADGARFVARREVPDGGEVLEIWDLAKAARERTLSCDRRCFRFTQVSPDGRFVAASLLNSDRVVVWEAATGDLVLDRPVGAADLPPLGTPYPYGGNGFTGVAQLAFAPDRPVLFLGVGNGVLRLALEEEAR